MSQKIKSSINIRKLQIGKPYTLLFTKDSIRAPKYFIYHPGPLSYTVVHLRDSIYGEKVEKPIRIVELQATGTIKSSLYETMINSGYNSMLTYFLADVYAWTIDFTRLDKGDRFKVIYTEKFVDDSISVGIEKIKAAYFEHRGKGLYAFEFIQSIQGLNLPILFILTKIDKVKKSKRAHHVSQIIRVIKETTGDNKADHIIYSTKENIGRQQLIQDINQRVLDWDY